jgi:hypothetical protein
MNQPKRINLVSDGANWTLIQKPKSGIYFMYLIEYEGQELDDEYNLVGQIDTVGDYYHVYMFHNGLRCIGTLLVMCHRLDDAAELIARQI